MVLDNHSRTAASQLRPCDRPGSTDSQAEGPRTHRLIRERRSAQPNTSAPMAPTTAPYNALNPPVISRLAGSDLPVGVSCRLQHQRLYGYDRAARRIHIEDVTADDRVGSCLYISGDPAFGAYRDDIGSHASDLNVAAKLSKRHGRTDMGQRRRKHRLTARHNFLGCRVGLGRTIAGCCLRALYRLCEHDRRRARQHRRMNRGVHDTRDQAHRSDLADAASHVRPGAGPGLLHRRDRSTNPRRLDVSAAYLTASQRPSSNAAPAAAMVVAVVIRVISMPVV
jgi:hypothetical protein